MSTPLRRSRSITRKDKERDSPPRVVANPQQLFDLCVESILESSEVSGKAVVHLPHVYAQYILCLALKRLKEGKLPSNSILHKLITCWPHSELSFNFRSNPLVVKKLGSLQPVSYTWSFGCIEPHVYYNIRGVSKSRYSTCSREIAVGLFNQAYRSDQLNIPVSMGTVDLSDFEQFSSECGTSFLDTEPATAPFYQLTRGIFPGRDAYECLSPEDFMFYKAKKPTLRHPSSRDHPPIKVYVNFKFMSISRIMEFSRLSKCPSRYRLYLKAIDVSSMEIPPLHSKEFDELDTSELNTLITSSTNSFSDAFLRKVSCLWILHRENSKPDLLSQALKLTGNLDTLFLSLPTSSSTNVLKTITDSATNGYGIKALGLFGGETKSSHNLIAACLKKLSSALEYLQLYDWTPSSAPLEALSACRNLRVVSLVVDCSHIFFSTATKLHSVGDLFKTLGELKNLEFIELGEQVDLQASDLVHLQTSLRNSLPKLEHYHLSFSYISLKRADLDDKSNEPIFQLIRSFFMTRGRGTSLLYRQSENFHLTLKSAALGLARKWLSDLRRNVCFKIGAENNPVSSLAHLRRLAM